MTQAPEVHTTESPFFPLAEATSRALAPWVKERGWFRVDVLAAEIAATFERRADPDFREGFRSRCPSPGSTPADFGLVRVAQGDGGEGGGDGSGFAVHAAIRFKGVNPERPFVEIEAVERAPASARAFEGLCDAVLNAFAVFHPAALRFLLPREGLALGDASRWEIVPDAAMHMGALEDLARMPEKEAGTVVLVPVPPGGAAAFHPWYVSLYEDLWGRFPELRENVPCETLDTLEECADVGALFLVEIDGQRAGVLAARPEEELGVVGWTVVEEILAPRVRGRGLGVSLQKTLARVLLARTAAGEGGPVLMGHIHRDNEASRINALRCGRPAACTRAFAFPRGRRAPWL